MLSDEQTIVDPSIFRAYDVRGVVGDNLSANVVYAIGRAFGSVQHRNSENRLAAVGRDGRASSKQYLEALSQGLCESGIDVIDLGLVPTPLVHYGAQKLNAGSAVVVTGSHNAPAYNGLKFALGTVPFSGSALSELKDLIESGRFELGQGSLSKHAVVEDYVDELVEGIQLRKSIRVVVDCGNGVGGVVARQLFEALGCEVDILYEDVDSSFPNHHPDPAVPENLIDLQEAVVKSGADVGIAFDGDGDRVGIVTELGENVWADRLLALFAKDILKSSPSRAVVFDVKCGASVKNSIEECQGLPVLSPTGHTNIKKRVREHRAVLGGEFSGHFCFPDRWYLIDDAIYAAVRFLELLSRHSVSASELIKTVPKRAATPELLIPVAEHRKFEIVERLRRCASFDGGGMVTIDGVRVDFQDGWGLVRASNTSPKLSLRFEADSEQALERIKTLFVSEILRIAPDLKGLSWD